VINKLRRRHVSFFIIFLVLGCAVTAAKGDDYAGAKVTVIKKSTTTASGRRMEYLKTEHPEVTALLVEIPPGGETGWHFHPVPVYAYVLSGTLTTEMENGEKHEYKEGDAIFEAVNVIHNGINLAKVPVKLIVFYTGEEGKSITVRVRH
jgi:quercetin dioxygenase-like cupin family protein